MRNYKTEGIIIKRSNFSEADRILTIFTGHYGKIKVIAKGVRKITSKRGGNVELCNLAEITLHEGRNFDILTEASVKESFLNIKKDLIKIAWAYHICELVDGLCPEKQENRKVFANLISTLKILNDHNVEPYHDTSLQANHHFMVADKPSVETHCNVSLPDIINDFELFLLRNLGFWPYDKALPPASSQMIIEEILEKKLKSKSFLQKIS